MQRYVFVVLITLAGCGETPPPTCTSTTLDTTCSPAYQPTFLNVYSNTIVTGCGSDKNNCHGPQSSSGLSFANATQAYQSLTRHVTVGDPKCSELIVRTHDDGEDYSMPPDSPLTAAEKCAILLWVADGAQQ